MGLSLWYAANLQYDGETLSKIDSGDVVIDFSSRLWKNATKNEKYNAVIRKVKKVLEETYDDDNSALPQM